MSELELRFPSDQPYAYFAVRGTPEEIQALDFEMLAALYVNTQFAVLKGTQSAKDAILGGVQPEPPKGHAVGDSVEVGGMTFTKKSEDPFEAPPGDPSAAAQRLAEGRKPRTVPEAEEMERQAVAALAESLGGATEIDDVNSPPWAGPKPAPKAKPWESEKPKTQVSADDFDF